MPLTNPLTNPLALRLITMGVAQFFDLGTFVTMVRAHGVAAEVNPIVAALASDYGIPTVALVKFALVILVASTTLILATRIRTPMATRLAVVVVFTGIFAGLVGGWSNAVAIGVF